MKADDDRFDTLEDFIEYSKTNKVQVGNSGIGAIWHLAAAGLAKTAGSTTSSGVEAGTPRPRQVPRTAS